MSTERALEFIHDVAGDPKLCSSVARADRTLDAWVVAAREAGYKFEPDDLKVVAEELVDEPVDSTSVIPRLGEKFFGEDGTTLTADAIERLKAVMQQGRYSGYYRPW
jgi:predicted ribosomally synthesized peptide with nif11-like leader